MSVTSDLNLYANVSFFGQYSVAEILVRLHQGKAIIGNKIDNTIFICPSTGC